MELYHYDRTIEAAPEDIFRVVDDDERLKEWSPIFEGNEYFTDETRGRGTQFRTRLKVLNRTYQFRSAITQYEADRFIEVHTYLRQGDIISSFRLMPEAGSAARVKVESRFDAKGRRYAVMLKSITPIIRRVLDSQMKKLEEIASSQTRT